MVISWIVFAHLLGKRGVIILAIHSSALNLASRSERSRMPHHFCRRASTRFGLSSPSTPVPQAEGGEKTRILPPLTTPNFTAMRSELLQRIQTLLENEDLEAIRKDVRTDIESFRALIQEDFRTQRDAWAEQDHEPDEKFQFQPSAEEIQFNELVDAFKSREKAWRQRIAEEQRANLEVKTGLIDELKNIIQEEENIGAAFAAIQ